MGEKMSRLLDSTLQQLVALLTASGQRPHLDLMRALRAKLAVALNTARLVGVLHGNDQARAPAISESETTGDGDWVSDAETLPSHGSNRR